VTNEAALATLAVNPKLTAETQQILASEGNPAVRDAGHQPAGADRAGLSVSEWPEGHPASLMQNASLCEEVQLMAVGHKDSDVLAIMARNPVVGESVCDMLLAINRIRIDESRPLTLTFHQKHSGHCIQKLLHIGGRPR
jgi:hypothetical protein